MRLLTIRLNNLVKISAFCIPCLCGLLLQAQEPASLSLQEAYELSRQHYPLIRQKDLIRQTEMLTIKNISTAFLPQVTIGAQATYQSDVTQVNIPVPGIKIPSLTKDQYKATAELSQLLYDGGVSSEQKNIQHVNASLEETRVEADIYQLMVRVNQLYFGILYQEALLKQTQLALADIEAGIRKVAPQVLHGTMLRSGLQVLQVQLLQVQQRAIEIRAARKGLADALALLINQPVRENTPLAMPATPVFADTALNRTELKAFTYQSVLLHRQQKLKDARNLPKASFFVQGGYGKPGLNVLLNQFDWFYIAGLRFNWSLGALYNANREKQLTTIGKQSVEVQKEAFLLNTYTQLEQQKAEMSRFAALVAADSAIVALRTSITDAAKAQLENAVITANDYLRETTAKDQAYQALALHRLQWLQAQTSYQLISGKL